MKKVLYVIPLAGLLFFAFGWQNKAEKTELEKFRARTKLEEQNREIANRAWEATGKGDFETLYIMRGTHQGEFAGIPATGNKIEICGIIIGRIENGKIV